MATLTDSDRAELLAESQSADRQQDFQRLRQSSYQLAPADYLAFLTSASALSKESALDRPKPREELLLL